MDKTYQGLQSESLASCIAPTLITSGELDGEKLQES